MQAQKIVTYLWFNAQAEEAATFYVSLFERARIIDSSRWGDGGPVPKGTVMMVNFELEGREYLALNGGPHFKFNEAISLFVRCQSQEEVDRLWTSLTANGGAESQCGWLKDRFGLSWQIIPTVLTDLLSSKEPGVAGRVTQAMLGMQKIDIAALERAAAGK